MADDIDDEEPDPEWERQLRAVFTRIVDGLAEYVPRKPRLLERDVLPKFELDSDWAAEQFTVYWNTSDARQAVNDAANAAKQGLDEAAKALDDAPTIVQVAVEVAGDVMGKIVEKTVEVKVPPGTIHASESAHRFPLWHLNGIPEGKPNPYVRPLDNPKLLELVQYARSLIEPIPKGEPGKAKPQPAGTLAWTKYDPKDTYGWMYVEPKGSPYGIWVYEKMRGIYDERVAAWKAAADDRTFDATKRVALRAAAWRAAAVVAVMKQEGAPSAVNTYDGLVLTCGLGLASTGALVPLFHRMMKDPNIRKTFYLCGFLFCGTQKFGGYQFINTRTDPPQIEYYGHVHTVDVPRKDDSRKLQWRKGEPNYYAFMGLQTFTSQPELIDMLIMVARDPLTRETVFWPNYELVETMVNVADSHEITNEALFVFLAEVKHNWSYPEPMIGWAIKHFSAQEAALPLGAERDRAIARGVFRYVLMHLQVSAWKRSVKRLETNVKTAQKKGKPVKEVSLKETLKQLVYGFDRLLNNYWIPMQTGVNTQERVGFKVPDFPPQCGERSIPGRCVVSNGAGDKFYDLGDEKQCGFLFSSNDVTLVDFTRDGNVKIKVGATNPTEQIVTRDGNKVAA